jgi:hypothetical protein
VQIGSIAKQIVANEYSNTTYYKQFDCSDIFAGISWETAQENVDSLRSMPGVVNVWPMRSVPMSRPERKKRVVPQALEDGYTMHHWTGVDRLHAAGIRGEGVKIAVIDTGIDYTHDAVCLFSFLFFFLFFL